jgi:FMN-dependent dehydrogenase
MTSSTSRPPDIGPGRARQTAIYRAGTLGWAPSVHPDDARRAIELGIDAMIVSNHGGRQADNAIASVDALINIREAVGRQPTILLDSGIRSGTDVLIAWRSGRMPA